MSHRLAHRFASKCFTPLELAHLKDNFESLALNENGVRHWNEEILSHFLGIPDGVGAHPSADIDNVLDAGPVLFRMVSYLGAFPFQRTLAPSLLSYEAIIKVVVLLTERYGKVLKRGSRDRIKLLFGSLADVGRTPTETGDKPISKAEHEEPDAHGSGDTNGVIRFAEGFAVDAPANDEAEDDDDDLALAALESLDAIEVFEHDQRADRSVYSARISIDTFRRLLALLLVIAPLHPQGTTSKLMTNQDAESIEAIQAQVDSIMSAFLDVDKPGDKGIDYKTFSRVITTSLPFLFDPLTPLFEHFLFSKNLDFSQRKESRRHSPEKARSSSPPPSPHLESVFLPGPFESNILNNAQLAHLSFFLSTSYPVPNLFRNWTRFHPVFSSVFHGESLTAFSHHVLTWHAPSLMLLKGVTDSFSSGEDTPIVVGAYLPEPWKSSSPTASRRSSDSLDSSRFPCLFQILPTHTVLPAAPFFKSLKSNMPVVSFSTKSGIALGCMIPPPSRASLNNKELLQPQPAGGGSLIIDPALENATFIVSDGLNGDGVFLPPGLSPSSSLSLSASAVSTTTAISIHTIEVWGVVSSHPELNEMDPDAPKDAVALQRAMWNFEAREAERRRTIHLNAGGGDSETQTGRALLEMAGIAGDSQYGHHRRY